MAKLTGANDAFTTDIRIEDGQLIGPWRGPLQMLAEQSYDDHASIHDDATAQKLGFSGGTIEGPTHFSQFAPLAVSQWGREWFERGCISVHYRTPVFEGEKVRARMAAAEPGQRIVAITMEKEDGSEVLAGTASLGPDHPATELDRRLLQLPPLEQPVLLADVKVGDRRPRLAVRMAPDQHMGSLYPFSLSQKLEQITEPSPWYADAAAAPWGKAIIPTEMISVLVSYATVDTPFEARGPAVGLFADQEIRLLDGPLLVDTPYEIEREVVAMSGSRRTESVWIRTKVYAEGSDRLLATTLLNSALLKDSYEPYAQERAQLYGA